jgi:hypothetical protein
MAISGFLILRMGFFAVKSGFITINALFLLEFYEKSAKISFNRVKTIRKNQKCLVELRKFRTFAPCVLCIYDSDFYTEWVLT